MGPSRCTCASAPRSCRWRACRCLRAGPTLLPEWTCAIRSFPPLRMRWRNSSASINVRRKTLPLARSSSVPKSTCLPAKEYTSNSRSDSASCGFRHARLSRRVGEQRTAPIASPQQAANTRQQNGQIERLGQVVVGARGKALQHVLRTAARGQHQQRNIVAGLAQLGSNREAIFAGKHDVEHQQIELGRALQQQVERSFAVADNPGGITLGFEIELQARAPDALRLRPAGSRSLLSSSAIGWSRVVPWPGAFAFGVGVAAMTARDGAHNEQTRGRCPSPVVEPGVSTR